MKRLIFLSCLLGLIPISSFFVARADDTEGKWVERIIIPDDAYQRYQPKTMMNNGFMTTSRWSPKKPFKSLNIGDTIVGTDGKNKTRSFKVGAINCFYHSYSASYLGQQYMWKGKWSCTAGRNKYEVLNIFSEDYDRVFDTFTTGPINKEDIVDLSITNNDVKLPIFVPLGQKDLKDPQSGYMHMSSGMEDGTFLFAKKGDPVNKFKTVNLERFSFFQSLEREVIDGFTPRFGACAYLTNGWTCFISDTWEGITKTISQAYTNKLSKTHLANYMICEDCKPIPHPALNRICPGFYISHITGEEFKDKSIPTYPEFFNKEGDCMYEKPWVVSPKK
tara:strand:+ start:129 stop:1130 length:1002 start_codon:yes stop_codon:yes gene_type:complete